MNDCFSSDFVCRRRNTALEMRRRLVAHIAAGGTTDIAAEVLENDCSAYTDPDRANREKLLFRRRPLLAGLSQDIPESGDCLVFEGIQPSVVIIRGNDGILRAFHNMCTHRGSKLVRADAYGKCQRRQRLNCPFHGWSFNLEGSLSGLPGSEGFQGVDLSTRGLIPVAVAEWNGLIFVQVEGSVDHLEVSEYLGAFAPEMAQLELGKLMPVRHSRITADADWKLVLDTYCEGYHFGTLHRSTIGSSYHSNVAVFDDFTPHWRIGFAERALDHLVGQPESAWPEPSYSGIHFMFPNVVVVVGGLETGETCVRVFRLFPGESIGTMSCHIAVYASSSIAQDPSRAEREFAQDDAESEITREDLTVAVEAYRNLLHSPDGFKVIYGRNEPALQSFHRAVAQEIGKAL